MEYEINKLKKKETRFLLINFMEKTFALEEYEDTNRIIPFRKGRLIKKKIIEIIQKIIPSFLSFREQWQASKVKPTILLRESIDR